MDELQQFTDSLSNPGFLALVFLVVGAFIREISVLLRGIGQKCGLVKSDPFEPAATKEGMAALEKKFDKVEEHNQRDHDALDTKIDKLDGKIDRIDEKQEKFSNDLAGIAKAVAYIQGKFNTTTKE